MNPQKSKFKFSEKILKEIVDKANSSEIKVTKEYIPSVEIGEATNFIIEEKKIYADISIDEKFDRKNQKIDLIGIDVINLKNEVVDYKIVNVGIEPND